MNVEDVVDVVHGTPAGSGRAGLGRQGEEVGRVPARLELERA